MEENRMLRFHTLRCLQPRRALLVPTRRVTRTGEMALSLPLLIGSAALAPLRTPPQFAPEMLPAAQVAEAMRQITATPNTFIVVDGNNVRGRVGFCLGKGELSALLVTWAERHQLTEQVVVAWDHGQRSEALVWRGVCHAFAGPRRSADDVIASDALPSLLGSAGCERVYVVTSDRELLWRCKVRVRVGLGLVIVLQ